MKMHCYAILTQIMTVTESEYAYEPPSEYFKDGYNLYKQMAEQKWNKVFAVSNKFLFLRFYFLCGNTLNHSLLS